MKTFEVVLDVTTVLRTEVQAETEAQAIALAQREAYEDTWGSKAVYSNADMVEVEVVDG